MPPHEVQRGPGDGIQVAVELLEEVDALSRLALKGKVELSSLSNDCLFTSVVSAS